MAAKKSSDWADLLGISPNHVRNLPAWKARTPRQKPRRAHREPDQVADESLGSLIAEQEDDDRAERRGRICAGDRGV
jgi:hypothetical protein